MTSRSKPAEIAVPEIIYDNKTKKKYRKGKFLGKGGFARCYEFTELSKPNMPPVAGKVISKTQLVKEKHKSKMSLEIEIHRSVHHRNCVQFYSFFEDDNFVYILLEICTKRSLMEMHKRRKAITEPEVRYYVKQIIEGCCYLHSNNIVHRDLKLGNLFLNHDMQVKIGDFGLASILKPGERKKTLCGTPNYIAPEVLNESGHGFEVDVWSLGCIVYTLAVGKPPFETDELKQTYRKIKRNEYSIPPQINPELARFIRIMLHPDPSKRPSMSEILSDSYLTKSYIPSRLPESVLSVAPRAGNGSRLSMMVRPDISERQPFREVQKIPENEILDTVPADFWLSELRKQVSHLLNSSRLTMKDNCIEDDAEHPASLPLFWISKWVDYTDKYGIGYQLCDNSIGVLFNDNTKLVLMNDEVNFHYIDRNGQEFYHQYQNHPPELNKKATLFKYFRNYMSSHLQKMGDKHKKLMSEAEEMQRVPHIHAWFRTNCAIIFHMTNGTVQINFFQDHVKILLCPMLSVITYINREGVFRAYKFSLLEEHGIQTDICSRLKYGREVLEILLKKHSKAGNA